MRDTSTEYARIAAEAFIAANREDDRKKSASLRERGYQYVDLIRRRECGESG